MRLKRAFNLISAVSLVVLGNVAVAPAQADNYHGVHEQRQAHKQLKAHEARQAEEYRRLQQVRMQEQRRAQEQWLRKEHRS